MSSIPKWRLKTGAFLRLLANYLDEKDLNTHAAKRLKQRYKVFDVDKTMQLIKASLLNPQYPYKEMLIRTGHHRELWKLTRPDKKQTFYFIWAKNNKAFVTFLTPQMAEDKINAFENKKKLLKRRFS